MQIKAERMNCSANEMTRCNAAITQNWTVSLLKSPCNQIFLTCTHILNNTALHCKDIRFKTPPFLLLETVHICGIWYEKYNLPAQPDAVAHANWKISWKKPLQIINRAAKSSCNNLSAHGCTWRRYTFTPRCPECGTVGKRAGNTKSVPPLWAIVQAQLVLLQHCFVREIRQKNSRDSGAQRSPLWSVSGQS